MKLNTILDTNEAIVMVAKIVEAEQTPRTVRGSVARIGINLETTAEVEMLMLTFHLQSVLLLHRFRCHQKTYACTVRVLKALTRPMIESLVVGIQESETEVDRHWTTL